MKTSEIYVCEKNPKVLRCHPYLELPLTEDPTVSTPVAVQSTHHITEIFIEVIKQG